MRRKFIITMLTCLTISIFLPKDVKATNKKEWKLEENKWIYVDSSNNRSKDWVKINNDWFYFNSNGEMESGWKYINESWYHLRENGVMDTGWRNIKGDWYYFNPSGSMVTGWQELGGIWYHFRDNGVMDTNWREIGGAWYYFDKNGKMESGWKLINNEWYHFKKNGVMSKGWDYIEKEWYYFEDSGVMKIAWKNINNKWYYFEKSGSMHIGWEKIDNKLYYFRKDGDMAVNDTIDGMKINGEGVAKTEEVHAYNVPSISPNAGDCNLDQGLTPKLNQMYGNGVYGNYDGQAIDSMGGTYTRLLSGQMSLDQAKAQLVGKYVEDGYKITDIKMINFVVPQEEWAIYGDGSDYIIAQGGMQKFSANKQKDFYTMWNHNGQDQISFTRVVFLMNK